MAPQRVHQHKWEDVGSAFHYGRRSLLAKSAGAAAVLLAVAASSPSHASACNPGRSKTAAIYVGGWSQYTDLGWEHISSTIQSKEPYVYDDSGATNKTNFSYAWGMLYRSSSNEWAQIGPATLNDGERVTFIQCYEGSGSPEDIFLSAYPSQELHTYTVLDGFSSGGDEFLVDNDDVGQCEYGSFWAGYGELGTEIHNEGDQVQGIVSDHQPFEDSTGTTITNSDSLDVLGSGSMSSPSEGWFNVSKDSSTKMSGWDGDCP